MTAKKAPSQRGRKSKLTEAQKTEIARRLSEGERAIDLASEYGVDRSAISRLFSQQDKQVKTVAKQIFAAENALKSLPITQQIYATNLVQRMRNVSMHLASAAEYGAATAHRLHAIAHDQVQQIDDADPTGEASIKAVATIAALNKTANDSSAIALKLVQTTVDLPEDVQEPSSDELKLLTTEGASKAYAEMLKR